MILFSVKMLFFLLQTCHAITTESSIQLDEAKITQLLDTLSDFSKQYNLRQFSLTREKKRVLKFLLKLNVQEHSPLYLFLPKREELKLFTARQQFKRHESFVRKVHVLNGIDMIVWIGILIHYLYQKKGPKWL